MVHQYKNTVKIPVINFFGPKNHFQPMKNERMSLEKESFTVALSVSLSHFSFVSTCVHPGELVELRMSWFTLTEDLEWAAPLPEWAEQLPFRYAHMSKAVSPMVRQPYSSNLASVDPSDTGPLFRYVDVQAFAQWAEHRRCGPDPGRLLAKALFGFEFDGQLMISRPRHEWVDDACDLLRPALATLCLAIDDVNSHVDLSEELTMDLVWFMARSATVLIWCDWDRQSRLDFTRALPVIPMCREVLGMATRRLAMGKGLAQSVAESWRKTLRCALRDAENDTPLNRQVRAELDRGDWDPSPPGGVDSWDEALHYRTRDEMLAEVSAQSASATPL